MNQRPDFVTAKREMKRLYDEYVKETSERNTPIHLVQRSRQRRGHQFEGPEEHNYQIHARNKYGEPILRSHGETCRGIQHIRPRQISGSNTMIGSRTKVGILGDAHPGLNSSGFFVRRCLFSLAGKWIPWQSTGGYRQIHLPHATFSHVQSLHRSNSTDDMCTLAQGRVVRRKRHSFIHASWFVLCCTRH